MKKYILLLVLPGCSTLNIDPNSAQVFQHASAGMATYYYSKTETTCTVGITTARDVQGSVVFKIDGDTCKVTATTGSLLGSEQQIELIKQLSLVPSLIQNLVRTTEE